MAAQVVAGNVVFRYRCHWSFHLRGRNVCHCQGDCGSLSERCRGLSLCLLMDSSFIPCPSHLWIVTDYSLDEIDGVRNKKLTSSVRFKTWHSHSSVRKIVRELVAFVVASIHPLSILWRRAVHRQPEICGPSPRRRAKTPFIALLTSGLFCTVLCISHSFRLPRRELMEGSSLAKGASSNPISLVTSWSVALDSASKRSTC
jgi:hypothetical protein